MKLVKVSEATALRRRVYFQVTNGDGKTPSTDQAGGQPQISTNGAAFTATGVGVLVAAGHGRYYAEVTTGAVGTIGDQIETRYQAGSTDESVGDTLIVVAYDPYGTGAAAGGVANPGATGGMTLTQARLKIRNWARDAAGDASVYTDADVDDALQSCGEQFARVTQCVRRVSDVALAADSAVVDVSALTGFHAERILSARIDGEACPLDRPGFPEVNRLTVQCAGTGVPTKIAFEVPEDAGLVYPTPDIDYTLKLQWWQPFTTWTPGVDGATADAIVLNVRPDYLLRILPYGPPALLQHNDPDMAYASTSWQKYLLVEKELTGSAGSTGARTTRRDKMQW